MDHIPRAFKQTIKYLLRIHQVSEALANASNSRNKKKTEAAMDQVFDMIKFFEMHDGWRVPLGNDPIEPEYRIFLECDDMVIKIQGTLGEDMYPNSACLKYQDDEKGVEVEYVAEWDDSEVLLYFASNVYFGKD